MKPTCYGWIRVFFLGTSLLAGAATASHARVEVTLDADTLTKVLSAVMPPTVMVTLPTGHQLALELQDFRVRGFDPAAGAGGRGHVLTSIRLKVPALGLDLALEPRLSLQVSEEGGEKVCVLRFEKMEVPLPVTGALDVSVLIPSLRVPTDAAWTVPVSEKELRVKSRLVETRMGTEALRLGFDLDVAPVAAAAAAAGGGPARR